MTTWNYRVIRTVDDGQESFSIYRVYYDTNPDGSQGKPVACATEPADTYGETVAEVQSVLNRFKDAMSKPVLEASYFEGLTKDVLRELTQLSQDLGLYDKEFAAKLPKPSSE